jgi:hypothetical protein
MCTARHSEMVKELGIRDTASRCWFFELVPGSSTGKEVVSEARDAVFGAVSELRDP